MYEQVNQTVRANETPDKAVTVQPIKINLKEGAQIPWKNNIPLSMKL